MGRAEEIDTESEWEDGVKVEKEDLVFRKMLADAIKNDVAERMNIKPKKKKHIFGSSLLKEKKSETRDLDDMITPKIKEELENVEFD